jgi:hypothetical protein
MLRRRIWRELMAGIEDADAHPLAGRQRRGARRDGGRDGQPPDGREAGSHGDGGRAEVDDGPDDTDDTDLDAVTRLMGFLRGDEQER